MTGRRILPFLIGTLVVAIAAATLAMAGGTRAQVDDPNDVGGALDVRRVWFDPLAGPPRWTVLTFAAWDVEQIRDRGFVFVFLDTAGAERDDYYALLRADGSRLTGALWRDSVRGADVRIRSLGVMREDGSSLAVGVPVGPLLGPFRTSYAWWVVTTFTGQVCRATCVDRVPDSGVFDEPVGSPTATATPSPSLSTR